MWVFNAEVLRFYCIICPILIVAWQQGQGQVGALKLLGLKWHVIDFIGDLATVQVLESSRPGSKSNLLTGKLRKKAVVDQ